jgi:hypothetical protein
MTYRDIQVDIKSRFGRSVKTCWIAHVKKLNGLNPMRATNRLAANRGYPCPDWARPLIENSMVRSGLIAQPIIAPDLADKREFIAHAAPAMNHTALRAGAYLHVSHPE